MERIRKGSDLPKKSGAHRASNKNIRRSSYRKCHQLYILLSFDSARTLEIHDVARATSCIACALEMPKSETKATHFETIMTTLDEVNSNKAKVPEEFHHHHHEILPVPLMMILSSLCAYWRGETWWWWPEEFIFRSVLLDSVFLPNSKSYM